MDRITLTTGELVSTLCIGMSTFELQKSPQDAEKRLRKTMKNIDSFLTNGEIDYLMSVMAEALIICHESKIEAPAARRKIIEGN